MSDAAPRLEIRDLRAHYSTDRGVVRAVDGVTLTVQAGQIMGLVGESGCGKSALALAIVRLSAARLSGEVLFEGRDVLRMPARVLAELRGRRIAIVFQDASSSLNPVLSIGRQLIEVIDRHAPASKAQAKTRSIEALAEMGLPDPPACMPRYPHELSLGMRQRVMFAMTLLCRPDLLIADEPTSALDVTLERAMLDRLAHEATNHGMSIILITHALGLALRYADRIAVMYAGRIVEEGPPTLLAGDARHPYTQALLRSHRLDARGRDGRLSVIPGRPPDPLESPKGCPFRPRCERARSTCSERHPELVQVGERRIACWDVEP